MARKSRMSRRLHGLTLRGLAMAAVGEAVLIVLVMGQPAFEQVMISVAVTVAIAVGGFGIYLAPGLAGRGSSPAPRSAVPRKPKPAPRSPAAPILRVIPQPAQAAPWKSAAPPPAAKTNPHIADAVSALENFGYKADLAKRLVMAAAAAAPADADVATLVRLALKK